MIAYTIVAAVSPFHSGEVFQKIVHCEGPFTKDAATHLVVNKCIEDEEANDGEPIHVIDMKVFKGHITEVPFAE